MCYREAFIALLAPIGEGAAFSSWLAISARPDRFAIDGTLKAIGLPSRMSVSRDSSYASSSGMEEMRFLLAFRYLRFCRQCSLSIDDILLPEILSDSSELS